MEFRRLHEGFGVEVIGCDVLGAVTAEDIATLRAAYDEHQLLLFRCDRRIDPGQQIEITKWFGPVMSAFGGQWGVLDNEKEGSGGRERLPFHLDYSFTESPFKGITLHALDLPPAGTTTEFVSNIHNWATLSSDLQDLLAPMTLQHRQEPDPETGRLEYLATHPVRLSRPQTGQPILFVTQYHAHRINELNADRSNQVIGQLFDHMYAPERIYEHHWKPYDFLIWDNLAIQHSRPKPAEPSDGPRALQRITISDLSLDEIHERARHQAEQRAMSAAL
jgi:taurine dioxygenase